MEICLLLREHAGSPRKPVVLIGQMPMADNTKPLSDTEPHPASLVRLIRTYDVPGYLPGWKQPALVAELQLMQPAPDTLMRDFNSHVEHAFGSLPAIETFPEIHRWPVLGCIAAATLGMLRQAGWPLLSALQVVKGKTADQAALLFPSIQPNGQAVVLALRHVLALLQLLATGATTASDPALLEARMKQLKGMAPRGMNSLRFLEAAHAQGVPWKRLTGNVHQFGWGARARWLDSSFTDETSYISMRVARSKHATAEILRNSGIPVPAHGFAANAAQAVQLAAQLGYPVVVKPGNLDQGVGVFTHLTDAAEVTRAFAAAAKLSREVLVEKHVFGNDYRLQVFKGEVYWATHRIPAGVTGDGTSTVRRLVDLVNADPARGGPGSSGFKRIVLDGESDTWLARQALTLDAIPEHGRYVRLHGAANVASGGTLQPVLDVAHPDNLALAARAANILRLDLAGVDLLIPDIRHSWLDTGAAICEVNAQPQMSRHLPAQLLPRLVQQQGRVPVVFIVGGAKTEPECGALFAGLPTTRPGFGLADDNGIWIGGKQVAARAANSFQACTNLLDDPSVTAVALHVRDAAMLRTGCPVDIIDVLVLAGPLPQPDSGAVDGNSNLALGARLAAQSRKVWLLDEAAQWPGKPGMPDTIARVEAILDHITRTIDT